VIYAWLVGRLGRLGVFAVTLLLAAFFAWLTVSTVDGWMVAAEQRGSDRQDAKWKAEIAESNRQVAEAQNKMAAAAEASEAIAVAEIDRLQDELDDLETHNAALPGGDNCGLGRGRVRLLPR